MYDNTFLLQFLYFPAHILGDGKVTEKIARTIRDTTNKATNTLVIESAELQKF